MHTQSLQFTGSEDCAVPRVRPRSHLGLCATAARSSEADEHHTPLAPSSRDLPAHDPRSLAGGSRRQTRCCSRDEELNSASLYQAHVVVFFCCANDKSHAHMRTPPCAPPCADPRAAG